VNYRALCEELTDRLADHVPAADPLLVYARHLLATPIGRPFQPGTANRAAVLTPSKVREMRELREQGLSYGQLGIRFGVSAKQAFRICVREQWAWVR